MNLASALVEARRFDEAAAVYRGVIARKPQHADARYSLGMVLYLTGRVAEARQTFGDLVRDQPGFAMGHFGLGIMAMEMNDQATARAELQEALRLKPDLTKAKEALATLR